MMWQLRFPAKSEYEERIECFKNENDSTPIPGSTTRVRQGYPDAVRSTSCGMKTKEKNKVEQPQPFTPGITKSMVRQHAYEMFRDKLPKHPLTLEDWVMAEKDLANSLDADNMPK
jgi:hypothetical protein